MIAAIILAAGNSSRMGAPKALLRLRGSTFLQTTIDKAHSIGLAPLVLVVGQNRNNILVGHDLRGSVVIENDAPETGPIGSIAMGISELVNHTVDAAIVLQVDRPCVSPTTLRLLIDAFRKHRASIIVPTFESRRGHPVLFARTVFDELLDARDDQDGARSVVRRDPKRVLDLPVADKAILEDVDTPEDYARLIKTREQPE